MGRVANYSIKGFMYQFNVSLKEILNSEQAEITLESVIEDILTVDSSGERAIQCKYHQASKFEWSRVSEPILQMIKTFTTSKNSHVEYILYAYFNGEPFGEKQVEPKDIMKFFKTNRDKLIWNYIIHIIDVSDDNIKFLLKKERLSDDDKKTICDYYKKMNKDDINLSSVIDDFLKRFKFIIGESYDDIIKENIRLFESLDFGKEDIEDLFYPNAIHKIATMSTLKDVENRKITRDDLIDELNNKKSTAISRWTKELKNYKDILKIKKRQMKPYLKNNETKRCIIIDPSNIKDFDNKIVTFINDYIKMYCSKPKLSIPCVLCIMNADKDKIDDIVGRLYKKGIEVETGFRGNIFFKDAFIKEPKYIVGKNWMQYKIKICGDSSEYIDAINDKKQEIIFQIADKLPDGLSTEDVNLEIMNVQDFEQIKYLFSMTEEVNIK